MAGVVPALAAAIAVVAGLTVGEAIVVAVIAGAILGLGGLVLHHWREQFMRLLDALRRARPQLPVRWPLRLLPAEEVAEVARVVQAAIEQEPISAHERESINQIRIVWRRYGHSTSWSAYKLLDRLWKDLLESGRIWRLLAVPLHDLERQRAHLDAGLERGSKCRLWDIRQRFEAAFGAYMEAIRWAHVAEEEGGIVLAEEPYAASYRQWKKRHPEFIDKLADLVQRPEFEDHLMAAVQEIGTHIRFRLEPKARRRLPGSLVTVVLRTNDEDGSSSIYLRNNDRTADFEARVSMDDSEGYFPNLRITGYYRGKSCLACWKKTGVGYTTRVTGTSDEAVLVRRSVGDGSPPTVKLLWPNCGVSGGTETEEPYESRSWVQGEEDPPITVVVTITARELPGGELRREYRVRSDGFLEAIAP